MRLDKFVSVSLNLTRSNSRKVIKDNNIKVNNSVITKNDYLVKENDKVFFLEKEIFYKEYRYFMLNKPSGFISANIDNYHKTVFDILKLDPDKYFIVGRLDIDTEGLLLITNDGQLAHKLTNPKNNIYKKYYLRSQNKLTDADVVSFKEGITIFLDEEYKCLPAFLEIVGEKDALISICEGKYHQIKKMFKAINNEVVYLKRISIGMLELDSNLKTGEYKEIDILDIKEITNF